MENVKLSEEKKEKISEPESGKILTPWDNFVKHIEENCNKLFDSIGFITLTVSNDCESDPVFDFDFTGLNKIESIGLLTMAIDSLQKKLNEIKKEA